MHPVLLLLFKDEVGERVISESLGRAAWNKLGLCLLRWEVKPDRNLRLALWSTTSKDWGEIIWCRYWLSLLRDILVFNWVDGLWLRLKSGPWTPRWVLCFLLWLSLNYLRFCRLKIKLKEIDLFLLLRLLHLHLWHWDRWRCSRSSLLASWRCH